jgi:hypothetical protein
MGSDPRAIQVLIESKPRSIPFLSYFLFTKPVSTFVRNACLMIFRIDLAGLVPPQASDRSLAAADGSLKWRPFEGSS